MSKPSLKSTGPGLGRRGKAISVSQETLIQAHPLQEDPSLPFVISPAVKDLDLTKWAQTNEKFLNDNLLKHGALLFRGFNVDTLEAFQHFTDTLSKDLLDYVYRSTPRNRVDGKVYTSTHYPADQAIPMHNEMSYTSSWPMKLWFCCLVAAETGGETPLADSRRVYTRLAPAVREKFAEKQVLYVRNYSPGLDLPWQEVFQTDSKNDVETFCNQADIKFEWISDDHLRTKQVCQAVAKHPKTGEMVWFNQAHLFHVTSLPTAVQEMLLSELDEEDLPRNTYYGDGTPIEEEALNAIRDAYKQELVMFPWEVGDVVMVDNMLVAHGRSAYTGSRRIVVAMAEAQS